MRAVRSAPAAARRFGGTVPPPFVAPPTSHAPPLPPSWLDGLTKPAFCRRQAAVFRRSGGGGSFAPLTPCRRWRHIQAAYGGGIVPPPTGGGLACSAAQSRSVRSSRPSLRAAVQKAHLRERTTASRIYRCGSIVAAHGQGCKFACIAEQRIFCEHCAALSARRAVF